MAYHAMWTVLSLLFSFSLAQYNEDPPTPISHVCGEIIDASLEGYAWFAASDIVQCLTSVPFNAAVGTRFVKYYNQTLQFQSTSAFLKNPPAGYQQPPFDIFASLQTVQNRIDIGYYHNQYAFEVDLQQISLYVHDAHTVLNSGILAQFQFSIPYYLIAASKDGKSLPEVYIYNETTSLVQGPALDTIDNTPAVQWLTEYAANQSFGMLEPNADWNQIMVSPSQLIIGALNPLSGGGAFYAGDSLNVTYKDGSEEQWTWLAYYTSPGWTGPLTTGGDFYNFFVLGLAPANYDETYQAYLASQANTTSNSTDSGAIDLTADPSCPSTTSWHDVNAAYPADTIMNEACLGLYSSGTLTGYLYDDISTAVLSIPTFDEYVDGTFTAAIFDFFGNATTADKVIIDLQSCSGGEVDLAFFVFNQFFPNDSPFAGSRLRDNLMANEFGIALTAQFAGLDPDSDDYYNLFGDEWVVTNRINAEAGRNFTSWQDLYGPIAQSGDIFSKVQQYDLEDPYSFLGFSYPACWFDKSCTQQWTAEDIVILTDGTCSSTCALFVEMMTQAGVRTVVVGGIPQEGPMQAVAGSRGAASYSSDDADSDADLSQAAGYNNDTGMYINYLGVTLRDQVQDVDAIPTQFLYQPATCRIFWTLKSIHNYSSLWRDTYNAIWDDTSICVPGSVGAQPPSASSPPATIQESTGSYITHGITTQDTSNTPLDAPPGAGFQYCDTKSGKSFVANPAACNGQGTCRQVTFPCVSPEVVRHVCIKTCTTGSHTGPCPNSCQPTSKGALNGARVAVVNNARSSSSHANFNAQAGQCIPKQRSTKRNCSQFQNLGEVNLG